MNHGLDFDINFNENFVFRCGTVIGFYSPKSEIVISKNQLKELEWFCFEHIYINVCVKGLVLFILPDFMDKEYAIFKLKDIFQVENYYILDPLKLDKNIINYTVYDVKMGIFKTSNEKEPLMLGYDSLDYFTSDWFGEIFEVRYAKKHKGISATLFDDESLTIKDILMVNKDVEYDCETIIGRIYYHISLFNYLNYIHKKMVKSRAMIYYSIGIVLIIGMITLLSVKATI